MSVTARPTVFRRVLATALGAGISMLVLGVAPAVAAPAPSFTVSPAPPVSGQSATYTSTSTVDATFAVAKVEWDFDNDGTFEVVDTAAPWTATHTYASAGSKTFVMRVTDNALVPAVTTQAQTVLVATQPPTAVFSFSPLSPVIGDEVLFASDSADPDGDALTHLWTFGDGVTSPLRNPTHAFSTPGTKTVTLKVTDPFGASSTTTRQVAVQSPLIVPTPVNRPPIANFVFGPRSPHVGDSVEFASSSVDPEGELRSQTWDLNGDGRFDDARGDDVLHTFTTPGVKTVRLRVEDGAGAVGVRERTITVRPAPVAPAGYIVPSPVISLNADILRHGARIRALGISAPRGSLVTVKCRGKGCPASRRRQLVKRSSVRFKTFERFLRAGIRLDILVTKPNMIGKYARFTIKAGRSPARINSCVKPGKTTPSRC